VSSIFHVFKEIMEKLYWTVNNKPLVTHITYIDGKSEL